MIIYLRMQIKCRSVKLRHMRSKRGSQHFCQAVRAVLACRPRHPSSGNISRRRKADLRISVSRPVQEIYSNCYVPFISPQEFTKYHMRRTAKVHTLPVDRSFIWSQLKPTWAKAQSEEKITFCSAIWVFSHCTVSILSVCATSVYKNA